MAWLYPSSTVVERSYLNPKIKGLKFATGKTELDGLVVPQ
jgi:hypothetical protein